MLIFLIIDVFGHAWESMEESVNDAFTGKALTSTAIFSLFVMFGGLGIGLLGLTWYESKYMKRIVQPQKLFSGSYKEDSVIAPNIEESENPIHSISSHSINNSYSKIQMRTNLPR
jgi:hypothetical protein